MTVEDSTLLSLTRCVTAAPSADNSQPWVMELAGVHAAKICYAKERVAGHTFGPLAPATLLSIGAVQENIRQTADAQGSSVDIRRWPDLDSDAYFKVVWGSDSVWRNGPAQSVLARHTNRFPYQKTPVPRELLTEIGQFTEGDARVVSVTDHSRDTVAGLIRRASQVRFQTREVHEWLGQSLRFTPTEVAQGDGLDVATLALPPGGAALLRFLTPWSRMRMLNRVGGYRLMAAIEAVPISAGPSLVAIVSPSSKDHWLDAGMLMERVWIALNQAGLAVHPYYVVPDQLHRLREGQVPAPLREQVNGLAEQCKPLFGLVADEQLQMLLRVGYPTREAPRSRRLPETALLAGK